MAFPATSLVFTPGAMELVFRSGGYSMKIRTKLRLNLIVVTVVIGAVVAAGATGMWAIRGKLSYLTQRSAPVQMRTAELQRTLQRLGAEMAETSTARTMEGYRSQRAHTEKALAEMKGSSEALGALTGEGDGTVEEMTKNMGEVFTITENRLKAEAEAVTADKSLDLQLENCSARLKELDGRIKRLQGDRTSNYVSSLQETKSSSNRLREIETFKIALNELLYTVADIQKSADRKGVLVARSRYSVALNKALQSDYLKSSKKVAEETKKLADRVDELIKVKSSASAEAEAKSRIEALNAELGEKTSLIHVIIEQEINASRDRYAKEDTRQGLSFNASKTATQILIANADYLSMGLVLDHLSAHLALATSAKEVDDVEQKLNQSFARAAAIQRSIEGLIGKLGAKNELALVRSAGGALTVARQTLFGADGYTAKVRKKIALREEAARVNDRVRQLIDAQAARGRETVTVAQGDQEKAVAAVNSMSRASIIAIVVMGCVALVVGIFFALSLERAFSRPIRDLTSLAEEFGNGNFSRTLDERRADEFGALAGHFNQAGAKLAETARQLKTTITSLATQSSQLSGTAEALACGAREQSQQTVQSASAISEMSQTITEVAGHAQSAAEAAKQAHDTAAVGSRSVERAVGGMARIASAVDEAAGHIRALGASSDQIGTIVNVIEDIADQTNLLALNAAIEAARAGEVGMGFAVVADEVRKLAQRTTEATAEISGMIRAIQADTGKSVAAMELGSSSVAEGVQLAGEARESLEAIVGASARGVEMVERIATATEEQSATTQQVNASMISIADITRDTERSMGDINQASEELSRLADELSRMASWFVVEEVQASRG